MRRLGEGKVSFGDGAASELCKVGSHEARLSAAMTG